MQVLSELLELYEQLDKVCRDDLTDKSLRQCKSLTWNMLHPVFIRNIELILQHIQRDQYYYEVNDRSSFVREFEAKFNIWSKGNRGQEWDVLQHLKAASKTSGDQKVAKIDKFVQVLKNAVAKELKFAGSYPGNDPEGFSNLVATTVEAFVVIKGPSSPA